MRTQIVGITEAETGTRVWVPDLSGGTGESSGGGAVGSGGGGGTGNGNNGGKSGCSVTGASSVGAPLLFAVSRLALSLRRRRRA